MILALFALLSGAPVIAPRVIELLRRETLRVAGDPSGFASDPRNLSTWLMDWLKTNAVAPDEAEVLSHATAYIDALAFSKPFLVEILRKWIPEIARYSFREIRMQRL